MKRKMWLIILALPLLLLLLVIVVNARISSPGYKGPPTTNFDGERFHNINYVEPKGFLSVLKWQLTKEEGYWPKWVDSEFGSAPPERVENGSLLVTLVNHSTVLIQVDGVNILTDPIWSERASPLSWAGPKRVRNPGIRFEDLPPIDFVLVSHNHYDHLDIPTLQRLSREHHPRILTGLGNAALLTSKDVAGAVEIDWWQSVSALNEVRITSVPAQHWSARGMTDRMKTLWTAYVIEAPSGNVFFAGDTGHGIHLEQIARKFSRFRLALLPIGAYLPRWFMQSSHLSPADAISAARILNADLVIPIHYGTFQLGDDGFTQAVDVLKSELEQASESDRSRFQLLEFGKTFEITTPQRAQK